MHSLNKALGQGEIFVVCSFFIECDEVDDSESICPKLALFVAARARVIRRSPGISIFVKVAVDLVHRSREATSFIFARHYVWRCVDILRMCMIEIQLSFCKVREIDGFNWIAS